MKKEHLDFLSRLKLISGMQHRNQGYISGSEILHDVESLMDELRVRRDEAKSYKAQIAL